MLSRTLRPLGTGTAARATRLGFIATVTLGLSLALASQQPSAAHACGCFAPPDVSAPLVQAGEKILFVQDGSRVTMHVQLRYSGRAGDFGWLLPLPAPPKDRTGADGIDIGVDELFSQLEQRTQPYFILNRIPCASSTGGPSIGCGASAASADVAIPSERSADQPPPVLVKQDTIGPYKYAVLRADNKDAMLGWLSMNGYVVPTGTDQSVAPYIRPGGYFLALKLLAGATAGDLQPVVFSYNADLPMIPIILTSVGATPNMGILVWVLGRGRAIPRNYFHTVINDTQLDWLNGARNYNDVVIKAVGEAQGKHAFVTEYAGNSNLMRGVLDEPSRFSVLSTLPTLRDPVAFVKALQPEATVDLASNANIQFSHNRRGFALNGQFFSVVGAYIPMPAALVKEGVTPGEYYQNIDQYLTVDRRNRPAAYADIEAKLAAFDPSKLATDLDTRIIGPTLRAGALFSGSNSNLSYLTRLYTTLSPEDMTVDPVFSFNPSLTDYDNIHSATLQLSCNDNGGARLMTDSGFARDYSGSVVNSNGYEALAAPYSLRIERIGDVGAPEVVTDNSSAVKDALPFSSGPACASSDPHRRALGAPYIALCTAAIAAMLLRRRRRTPQAA